MGFCSKLSSVHITFNTPRGESHLMSLLVQVSASGALLAWLQNSDLLATSSSNILGNFISLFFTDWIWLSFPWATLEHQTTLSGVLYFSAQTEASLKELCWTKHSRAYGQHSHVAFPRIPRAPSPCTHNEIKAINLQI